MEPPAHVPSPESLLEHRVWLRGIARGLVGDEDAVDEVEQRTWMAVLRNRRPVRSVRAWLRRVVRSVAVDAHRSERRRRGREEATARPEALPPTADLVLQAEAQSAVARAVTALPEPYRTTVLLRYFRGLPVEGVAAEMGAPVATVKTRLTRAHALLRAALDSEFGDRRAWCAVLAPLWKVRTPAPVGAATTGALLMAGKAKVAVAALVLLLGVGAWWAATSSPETTRDAAQQRAVATATTASAAARVRPAQVPPEPAAVETFTVGADVVDSAGRAVAGARVELARDAPSVASPREDPLFRGTGQADASDPTPLVAITTPAGAADLAGVPAGEWRLRVVADGFALHEERLRVAGTVARRRIVLRPACVLAGRVLRADGSPAVGAAVLVDDRAAAVAADGAYRVDALAPGVHGVRVTARGVTQECGQVTVPDVAVLDLRLRGGAALRGRVVDAETEAPIAGACVRFRGTVYADLPRMLGFGAEAVSAEDGTFAWDDLPTGIPYLLTATRDGFASFSGGRDLLPRGVHLLPGLAPEVVLRMRRGADAAPPAASSDAVAAPTGTGSLAGTVRRADGRPVADVLLDVSRSDVRGAPVAGTVGTHGAFRVVGLAAGTYTLRATAAGCVSARVAGLVVEDGGTRDGVDVVLASELTISGRVTDTAGAAVSGAEISVASSEWGSPGPSVATSGPDGSFVVGRLAAGDWYLRTRAGGFAPSGATVAAGARDVEIRLERALTISGTVLDAVTGAPVAGVPLHAEMSSGLQVLYRETASDASGRFVLDDLAPDTYRICVGPMQERWAWGAGEFVLTSVDGVRAGAVDVRVPVTRGLAIAGRVIDADGRPAGGGVVDALRPAAAGARDAAPELVRRARVAADGTFRIPGLPPGTYDLAVGEDSRDPGPAALAHVDAGRSDVVVTARPPLRIEGRLVLEDGTPLPQGPGGVELRRRTADGREEVSTLGAMWDVQGRFRTNALDADGVWDIVVTDVPGRLGAVVRGVKAGARDVEVVVRTGTRIEGCVVDASGDPVPAGVPVAANAEDADGTGRFRPLPGDASFATTDAAGRFVLARLGDRPYRLRAGGDPSDFVASDAAGVVRPGGDAVELRVVRGVSLSGRLLDARGEPLRGALVQVTAQGGLFRTDAQGRFTIRALAPGRHPLFAWVERRRIDLGEVAAPAEEVELTVRDE